MARLPKVNGDDGNWGDILNNYLSQSHTPDGALSANTVGAPQLKQNSVTSAAIAPGAVTSAAITDAAIPTAKLSDLNQAIAAALPGNIAEVVASEVTTQIDPKVTAAETAKSAAETAAMNATAAKTAAETARDASLAVPATSDGIVAGLITRVDSATAAALSSAFAGKAVETDKLDKSMALTTYTQQLRNPIVGAIGDSITKAGYTAPTSSTGPVYTAINYLMWGSVLSNGGFRIGPTHATGGYTTAQILAEHVPAYIAATPRPGYAIVHCGTNDIGSGVAAATTRANLSSIWGQLWAAGITPILTTILPRSDMAGSSANPILVMNTFIARQALLNGWPLVDLFTPMVEPVAVTIKPGQFTDPQHPNSAGAKLMGQTIADTISRVVNGAGRTPPPLATGNTWPNTSFSSPNNALMINATSGLPTEWFLSGGTTAGTGLSVTAMAANEGVGNWFNFTCAGNSTGYKTSGSTVVPGNRIAIGFRFKSTGGPLSISVNWSNSLWKWDLDSAVTLGTFYQEIVVPASYANANPPLQFWSTQTGATISIGQVTMMDLTALGLA